MHNLFLADDTKNICSPYNVVLAVFKVVNTQVQEDKDIKAKCIAVQNVVKTWMKTSIS